MIKNGLDVNFKFNIFNKILNINIKNILKQKTYLIDGFPRNANNYYGWEQLTKNFADVLFMLTFECSEV